MVLVNRKRNGSSPGHWARSLESMRETSQIFMARWVVCVLFSLAPVAKVKEGCSDLHTDGGVFADCCENCAGCLFARAAFAQLADNLIKSRAHPLPGVGIFAQMQGCPGNGARLCSMLDEFRNHLAVCQYVWHTKKPDAHHCTPRRVGEPRHLVNQHERHPKIGGFQSGASRSHDPHRGAL